MLKVDLHVHSIRSGDAFNTIQELAKNAAQKRMEAIAITEHGPAVDFGPAIQYFRSMWRLEKEICGVKILTGCETNIVNLDGELDLPDDVLAKLDIVLAGLHTTKACPKNPNVAENTKAVINAIKKNRIHIITHPYKPKFPVDIEEVFKVACDYGTLLEVNLILLQKKEYFASIERLVELAIKNNTVLAVCSDAHVVSELGDDSSLKNLAQQIPARLQLGATSGMKEVLELIRGK